MPFVKISQLKNPYPKAKRKSRYVGAEIRAVMQSNRINPSVSGSVPSDVRLREAAGSDAGKMHKLSGPGTPHGMTWVKTRNEPAERQLCTCDKHRHDPETMK